jgi:hypothetical protein
MLAAIRDNGEEVLRCGGTALCVLATALRSSRSARILASMPVHIATKGPVRILVVVRPNGSAFDDWGTATAALLKADALDSSLASSAVTFVLDCGVCSPLCVLRTTGIASSSPVDAFVPALKTANMARRHTVKPGAAMRANILTALKAQVRRFSAPRRVFFQAHHTLLLSLGVKVVNAGRISLNSVQRLFGHR